MEWKIKSNEDGKRRRMEMMIGRMENKIE